MTDKITLNYVFHAENYDPESSVDPVPRDNYLLRVTATSLVPVKDDKTLMFKVASTIVDGPYAGRQIFRHFNLWHDNVFAAERSHKELSALSHVTGIFDIDMNTAGSALVGGTYRADIDVEDKYNRVKQVYDVYGNEPVRGVRVQSPAQGYNSPPAQSVQPQSFQPAQTPQNWAAPVEHGYNSPPAQSVQPQSFQPAQTPPMKAKWGKKD